MDTFNKEYYDSVLILQTTNTVRDIEKSLKRLLVLRNKILTQHPEYIDSIVDIDFCLARGAYRINDIELLEKTIQKHYYNDYRFKKLYQIFKEMETANVWNNIVKTNKTQLEKTFVRSLSVIIITCACLSVIFRK